MQLRNRRVSCRASLALRLGGISLALHHRGLARDVQLDLCWGQAGDVVGLEPQQHPRRHHGPHLQVVPLDVEQDQVRRALQRAACVALLDDLCELVEAPMGTPRLVERHAHALALEEEHGIEGVDRTRPALRREVERVLLADREVELRLKRVEQQVDLVHDQDAALKEAEPFRQRAGIALHRRVVLAPRVAKHIQLLEELELQRLDRGGRRKDNAPIAHGRLQLGHCRPRQLGRAVKGEREDALADDGREGGAQRRLGLLQQRRRHRLHHESFAIAQHEREERAHDGRLAAAHQHLFDEWLARAHRTDELVNKLDLCLAEHDVVRELEDRKPRVVHQTQRGALRRARRRKVVSAREHVLRKRARLNPDGGGSKLAQRAIGTQEPEKPLTLAHAAVDLADAARMQHSGEELVEDRKRVGTGDERVGGAQVILRTARDEEAEEEVQMDHRLPCAQTANDQM
eukprot:2029960-Prymnesium_polylepis.1